MSRLPPPLNANPGKHRQITEALQQRILAGTYVDRLPSYDALTAEFSVTRVTLSKAISTLVKTGLITPAGTRGVLINRLRRPRTRRLAVVVPGLGGPLMTNLLVGGRRAADRAQHELMVTETGNDLQRVLGVLSDLYGGEHVDGVVIATMFDARAEHAHLAQHLLHEKIPAVLILDPDPVHCANLHTVCMPDLSGEVVQHLIDRGCRRILAVVDPESAKTNYLTTRLGAWSHTLETNGLLASKPVMLPSVHGPQPTRNEPLLDALSKADGVFCITDQAAIRLMSFCLEHRIAVPSQLRVAGYDDIHAARLMGLTTVAQPFDQVGELAIDLLIQDIEGRLPNAVHRTIAPTLQIRRTTGL